MSAHVTTEKLIAAVLERPSLWDKKDPNYHNRCVINKKWDEIAKEFNIGNRAFLKKKWKHLRDGFRQELKKVPKSDPSIDPCSFVSWAYFKPMLFLRDQMKSRKPYNKKNKQQNDKTACEIDDELDELDSDDNADEVEIETELQQPPPSQSKKVKIIADERRKPKLLPRTSRSIEESDENIAFFESLLPHVRRIHPTKILLCRMEIQKIVNEFAYNSKDSNSNNWEMVSEGASSLGELAASVDFKTENNVLECKSEFQTVSESDDLEYKYEVLLNEGGV